MTPANSGNSHHQGADVVPLTRLLAYRAAAHQLTEPADRVEDCAVLDVGVRDNPVGGTAAFALSARLVDPLSDLAKTDTLTLGYTVRGALHAHRSADWGLVVSAFGWDGDAEPAPTTYGIVDTGPLPLDAAYDAVISAIRNVMGDSQPRTKSELSAAVTRQLDSDRIDPAVAPWCPGCAARHVHDGMFRAATLPAGLTAVPEPNGGFQLHPGPRVSARVNAEEARTTVVRAFLRLTGVANPAMLGSWAGITLAAAKRWWEPLADDVVPVHVVTDTTEPDGSTGRPSRPSTGRSGARRRFWAHRDDLDAISGAEPATGVHALPPYDPLTELADRDLLVPDRSRRQLVWKSARNPGVLLVDGQLHGLWSHRRHRRGGQAVTVRPFRQLTSAQREASAERLRRLFEPGVTVREIDFVSAMSD